VVRVCSGVCVLASCGFWCSFSLCAQQLKRVTPEGHNEHTIISNACDAIGQVCVKINEHDLA